VDSKHKIKTILMKKLFLTAAAAVALASSSTLTLADTTWSSTAQNTWANSVNWGAGLPNGSASAIFQDLGTAGLVHTIDVAVANTITRGFGFGPSTAGSGFTIMSSSFPTVMQLNGGGAYNGILNSDSRAQTIGVPLKMFSVNGFSGSSAAQTWNAAAGNLFITGAYKVSGTPPSTVDNNGGRLTIDGAFNTTIGAANGRGDIVGVGGLTKDGTGTLFLGGTNANTFSGGTIIDVGSIVATKANALGTGGLTLSAGTTLDAGGFNQTLGTLTVTGSGARLDFGAAIGANTLTFANSSAISWTGTLTIFDFNPSTDKLRIGTDATGLTITQRGDITFNGFGPGALIDSSGFVTIPEPSTLTLCFLGGLALALRRNSRIRQAPVSNS
jgi:fibronectin-binding autotransporter adhesin